MPPPIWGRRKPGYLSASGNLPPADWREQRMKVLVYGAGVVNAGAALLFFAEQEMSKNGG